jgi:hypothetical protein
MPLFEDARLQPFLNQAGDARVADPMLQESYEPCLVNTIEGSGGRLPITVIFRIR